MERVEVQEFSLYAAGPPPQILFQPVYMGYHGKHPGRNRLLLSWSCDVPFGALIHLYAACKNIRFAKVARVQLFRVLISEQAH